MSDPSSRELIVAKLAPIFRRGLRLRNLMNEFALSYPLRRLKAGAFAGSRSSYDTIIHLSGGLPSSTLAEIIPRSNCYTQAYWLLALKHWISELEERHIYADALFRWAVRALAQKIAPLDAGGRPLAIRRELSHVADFAAERQSMFNECWSFFGALEEAEIWRKSQNRHFDVNAAIAADVEPRRDINDASFLPHRIAVSGYEFVGLRSAEELLAEGRAMRHCAGSYAPLVGLGRSRIYSIRKNGIRWLRLSWYGMDFRLIT